MRKFESSQKDESRVQSDDSFKAEVRNVFTITGRMNCALSLAGRIKSIDFIFKLYLYLTVKKSDFS